ncbi:MAG TPA: hypothetical protein VF595_00515 [Tepidisphaeraceae bacterium]|jgi:hypothetical protein
MSRPTGLRGILFCHFSAYLKTGGRQVRPWRVGLLGVLPCAIGATLGIKVGPPRESDLSLLVAVLSVLGAVLIGLLPLIYSVISQSDSKRRYAVGESPLAMNEIARIQALQDLHAAVAWSVILLVGALALCVCLIFFTSGWYVIVVASIIYAICCSTALAFFDIARGIFEAIENHAEMLKRQINNNVALTSSDHVEE